MGIYDQLEGMEEILDDFVVETNELIDQLNDDLLVLENGDQDDDLINRVFRAYHTIKGTSGFLSFDKCTELAHAAEDVLNTIRNGKLEPSPQIVDVLLETIDWFTNFITDVQNREESDNDITELVSMIEDIFKKEGQNGNAKKQKDTAKPEEEPFDFADIPEELITEFHSESQELIDSLSNDLLNLESPEESFELSAKEELVNSIFRAFHTLKGNSGLMNLDQMSQVAHKSEDILNLIRDGKLTPTTNVIDALLSSVDWIKNYLEAVREKSATTFDTTEINTQQDSIINNNNAQVIEEVKNEVSPEKKNKIKVQTKRPRKKIDQTIRVDVVRLDKLMNLAGELVLGKNRLLQVTSELNQNYSGEKSVEDLYEVNNSLGYVTTEIQESVMQMRMLPISNVFRKFPRLVRDLAREQEKEIELAISGEDTELDRSVIEAIGDPLVHLLRNAVDHGIEIPDVRKKQGKSGKGTVSLAAFQEGNHIVIKISDDGAGINLERVKGKAIEKNIITEDEAKILKNHDIINLIFKPGFSTAKVITDVSGRGVGMDVVKSNISKLNGTVDITSEKGEGSTFTIKLPLTLTILTGMVIRVFDEYYIIPLISISETIKLKSQMISHIKGQEVIRLRESVLPLIRLDELLDVTAQSNGHSESYVVIVAVADKQLGLVVSELLGQEETVVKPLGQTLGSIPHIGGATIRGDGKVCLILDIPEMIRALYRT